MSTLATWWSYLYNSLNGSGSRPKGLQSSIPLSYSAESASAVSLDTAFQLSAVWACCRLITESIAGMPIIVYDVDAKGVKTRNTTHPVAVLFSGGKINKWQTRGEFMETMTMQQTMQGNCYALKQYNSVGSIIGLMPFMSQDMQVALTADNGDIIYRYQPTSQDAKDYNSDQILHVKCMGNGIIGLSPLGYARNSIGIGQAAENSVTRIYSNGAKPSGALMLDKILTDAQRDQMKTKFADLESGTQDRLFILEAGMKYQQISMTPQDIELLSTRRFQIEDIARFFGVPSVLINDTQSATVWGTGVQKIVEGFYKLNLRPYARRYEEAFMAGLFSPAERTRMTIEFDFQDFLEPDLAERVKTYGEAVSKGIMAPNEARKNEGWKPLEGGDRAFMQQQMIPLDMLGTVQQSQKEHEEKMVAAAANKVGDTFNIVVPEVKIPQPVVNVDAPIVHMEAPHVHLKPEIKVDNPAPIVTVTNDVRPSEENLPAPVVNIAPANIKVEAPNVNVTPTIAVKLPKRKRTTTMEYDGQDRIKKSTQLEEDA